MEIESVQDGFIALKAFLIGLTGRFSQDVAVHGDVVFRIHGFRDRFRGQSSQIRYVFRMVSCKNFFSGRQRFLHGAEGMRRLPVGHDGVF